MRIVAIDYGKARIGMAISDPLQIIATPFPTIESSGNAKKAAERLAKALTEIQKSKNFIFTEIVVGLPIKLNGSDSDTTLLVREFVRELQALVEIPVQLFDERLTTVQADRALREGNFNRKSRAQKVDGTTATIILQNYLDMKKLRS